MRYGWLRHGLAVAVEALRSALSQPVASITAVVVVALMCAAVVLTTGRAVGAEQDVVASIDAAGTRTIVVRAESLAGVDTSVLERLRGAAGIEWAGALGEARDVRPVGGGGSTAPLRQLWTEDLDALGVTVGLIPADGAVVVSRQAAVQLGLPDAAGGLSTTDGLTWSVVGTVARPALLGELEPLVLAPERIAADEEQTVAVLVVVATDPALVDPVSGLVTSVLGATDPSRVTVSSSEDLSTLRGVVAGQLRTFSAGLVAGVLTLAAALLIAIFSAVVVLRRRDFGRRRALGASQSLLVGLVVTQVVVLASLGAAIGVTGGITALSVATDPLPGLRFCLAVAVLAVGVSAVASIIPAVLAARRDPIRELRVA